MSKSWLPVIPRTDYRSDTERSEIWTNCYEAQQTGPTSKQTLIIDKQVQIFYVDPVLMCTCSFKAFNNMPTLRPHFNPKHKLSSSCQLQIHYEQNQTNVRLTKHLPSVRFHELQECKPEGRSRKSSDKENSHHNQQHLLSKSVTSWQTKAARPVVVLYFSDGLTDHIFLGLIRIPIISN